LEREEMKTKPKMNAAERIAYLAERAQMRGEAFSKVFDPKTRKDVKLECFLSAGTARVFRSRGGQRLCFRVDGVRIARFDLFVYLEEVLSK
jgi:hypothetical protein